MDLARTASLCTLLLVILSSCTTIYPECSGYTDTTFKECQRDERIRREQINLENWIMCDRVLPRTIFSITGPYNPHLDIEDQPNHVIRSLLIQNECKHILNPRGLWIDV